jgi:tRNA-dihydrouridine synthase A
MNSLNRRLCVAPMMDWTDRHCRWFHRLFAPHALLYTEMLVAMALKLGGCDPRELAQAAAIGAAAGYAEINLNCGCPSDRVRDGAFGACLMADAPRVAECVARMREAVDVPVTVKCRIGLDQHQSWEFFEDFAGRMQEAGVAALIVHARIAVLGGLSPKENREVPPLNYAFVHRLKAERPTLEVILNGGLVSAAQALGELAPDRDGSALDGVMLGRIAYHQPRVLADLEQALFDPGWCCPEPAAIVEAVVAYARAQARAGVRLHSITRHMHGLIAGCDGARAWRRFLSEVAARPDAQPEVLYGALGLLGRLDAA